MSLTKPSRVFINNLKRGIQDFPDQFNVQLPSPIQGLTRLTIQNAIIEYNPLHPNFPPYTNQLDISASDVGSLNVVTPETEWPKNFEKFINNGLVSAGSTTSITIDTAEDLGLPGFLTFTSVSGTGEIEFLGQSSLANPEKSIMERLGLSYRFASLGTIPELFIRDSRAVFRPEGGSGTTCPGNFLLGRTGSIYILTDLDNGALSDANIQNLFSVIAIRPGTNLGDNVVGEDTNSITTSVNPSSDFNRIRILLFDDAYQPLEMREEQRTLVEFHLGYDRPDSVVIG